MLTPAGLAGRKTNKLIVSPKIIKCHRRKISQKKNKGRGKF